MPRGGPSEAYNQSGVRDDHITVSIIKTQSRMTMTDYKTLKMPLQRMHRTINSIPFNYSPFRDELDTSYREKISTHNNHSTALFREEISNIQSLY